MKHVALSVVILAKNSQELLKDCIASVSFADEIIVVDTGSTDTTVSLAKSLGAKVIKGIENNFSENRNKGLAEAKGKWVLYIDTDERVSSALAKEIRNVILGSEATPESDSGYSTGYLLPRSGAARMTAAYTLQRKNFYLGNNPWPKIEQLERLFKKESLKGWYGKLHETPKIEGNIGHLHGYLLHYTHRDLASMLNKTIDWSQIEAQLRFDTNHPKIVWWRLVRVMMTGFYDSYIAQGGFKAGTVGLIESMYQGYSMFITYARLWEMQKTQRKGKRIIRK